MLKDKTILFAEDDIGFSRETIDILNMLFAKVYSASNGNEAYELYKSESPDIILANVNMVQMDGITLAQKIRHENYNIPIIMLTSFSDSESAISAANLSVDGYLIKPVGLEQFLFTLRNAIQRISSAPELIVLGNQLYYNMSTHEVYHHNKLIALGRQEQKLLRLFIINRHRTLRKDEIKQILWPTSNYRDSSMKNVILRLRKKLGIEIIVSVLGVGYRLKLYNETEEER